MKTNPHSTFAHYPLLQLAISLAVGIIASTYHPTSLLTIVILSVTSALIALISNLERRQTIAGFSLLLAFFFAGGILAFLEQRHDQSSLLKVWLVDHPGETCLLTGVLDGPPEFARGRLYLTLRVETVSKDGSDLKSSGVVSLFVPIRTAAIELEIQSLQLRHGARLRVTTVLNRADQYRNPGVSMSTEYLDRKGFDASGVVRSPASIVRLDDATVFQPL